MKRPSFDNDAAHLTADAAVFLKRWQNNRRTGEAFATLSETYATILNVESDLQGRELHTLVDLDLFELIDRKILSELVRRVADRTLSAAECETVIRRRRDSHWYATYAHLYEAVDCASRFLQTLDGVDLTVRSLAHGIEQYSRVWYRLDQLYRTFVFHARRAKQPTLLAALAETVENRYTNHFLLTVNDLWQPHVDAALRWEASPVLSQAHFYKEFIHKRFLTRGLKVFVVISDALRYEVGEELLRRIRQEDRYDAELVPALTLLPSYTQLGMAALLAPRDPCHRRRRLRAGRRQQFAGHREPQEDPRSVLARPHHGPGC